MTKLFDRDEILRLAAEKDAADTESIKKALASEVIFIKAQLIAGLHPRAEFCDVELSQECAGIGSRELKLIEDDLRLTGFGVIRIGHDDNSVRAATGDEPRPAFRVFRDAQAAEFWNRQQDLIRSDTKI